MFDTTLKTRNEGTSTLKFQVAWKDAEAAAKVTQDDILEERVKIAEERASLVPATIREQVLELH